MVEKKRKSIAPTTNDELPNERRCKECWQLLTQMELPDHSAVWYCSRCQRSYGAVEKP